MSDTKSSGGGVGFAGMLTILFIGLKLTGHVQWSWWLVLSPVWAPLCAITAVVAVAASFVWALALIRKQGTKQ